MVFISNKSQKIVSGPQDSVWSAPQLHTSHILSPHLLLTPFTLDSLLFLLFSCLRTSAPIPSVWTLSPYLATARDLCSNTFSGTVPAIVFKIGVPIAFCPTIFPALFLCTTLIIKEYAIYICFKFCFYLIPYWNIICFIDFYILQTCNSI